jgi:hypothetical protein
MASTFISNFKDDGMSNELTLLNNSTMLPIVIMQSKEANILKNPLITLTSKINLNWLSNISIYKTLKTQTPKKFQLQHDHDFSKVTMIIKNNNKMEINHHANYCHTFLV